MREFRKRSCVWLGLPSKHMITMITTASWMKGIYDPADVYIMQERAATQTIKMMHSKDDLLFSWQFLTPHMISFFL